jgi:DNA-binding CsgD family transcriptional regulator
LLSRREVEVVRCVAEGLSNREIAQRLGLTEHTVKNYLFRIFDKLGVSKRVEVVLYAYSLGGMSASTDSTDRGNGKKLSALGTDKVVGTPPPVSQFPSPSPSRLAKA